MGKFSWYVPSGIHMTGRKPNFWHGLHKVKKCRADIQVIQKDYQYQFTYPCFNQVLGSNVDYSAPNSLRRIKAQGMVLIPFPWVEYTLCVNCSQVQTDHLLPDLKEDIPSEMGLPCNEPDPKLPYWVRGPFMKIQW